MSIPQFEIKETAGGQRFLCVTTGPALPEHWIELPSPSINSLWRALLAVDYPQPDPPSLKSAPTEVYVNALEDRVAKSDQVIERLLGLLEAEQPGVTIQGASYFSSGGRIPPQ